MEKVDPRRESFEKVNKEMDRISIDKLQSSERIKLTACPVCAVGLSRHYAIVEGLNFFQCDSCQSVYLDPAILASIDCGKDPRSFDEGFQKRERDKSRLRAAGESLTRAGEAILYARRPVRRFLDVGAGGGELLDELAWLFPEDEDLFHGIEAFPPSRHSDHRNFKIGSLGSLEGTFDAGVCIEVLGYLTPKNLQSFISDLSRVSEIDSMWLFQTGEPNFEIGDKKPEDLGPLSRGHIVSYSLKGLSPIFERSGFKIQEYPGKSWAFIAEFRPSGEIPFEERFSHPLEFNKKLLMKSALLYLASFDSARSSFYSHEYREKTEWAKRLERELLESRSAHSQLETRYKREMKERESQIQSLKKDLEAITASKSWVVTQHLRKIAGRIPPSIRGEAWKMGRSIFRVMRRGWHLVRRVFHNRNSNNRFGHSLIRLLVSGNRKKYFSALYRRLESMPILGPISRKVYARYKTQEGNYQVWIQNYDTLTDKDREVFKKAMEGFALNPLISVVMPVYNTPKQWLVKAIESVRSQIYPHWELCISDDASTLPDVRKVLDEYARLDPRIHAVYRKTNGHICANSNTALTLATGEFIALLDADDELSEHALFWVAYEINRHPDVDLIYSDSDIITESGVRRDPYFKPDWNPALILSQNYFCHLGVFRHSLLKKIGGFREGFEGSQDHDIVLRCYEETTTDQIRHIPRILYHWRAIPGSTASASGLAAKPYAWVAGKKSIEEFLVHEGMPGIVNRSPFGDHYQVSYLSNGNFPKVSIIIPSTCKLHLLKPCMESLLSRTTYPDFEILLVINEISYHVPEQAEFLKSLDADPRIRILVYEDQPFNYSKLNNWAIAQTQSPVLCLMNDDTEVITRDWLEKLVVRTRISKVGAVGPLLLYPDDRIQHAGVILGLGGVAGHQFVGMPKGAPGYFGRGENEQDLSCVTAACMVLKREAFEAIGGFNEELAVAFNDVDLCIRIRNDGWRILWTPEVEIYHHESASVGQFDSPERASLYQAEAAHMRKLWGETLDNDPFYNPNLSLDSPNHDLAFPPRISSFPVMDR